MRHSPGEFDQISLIQKGSENRLLISQWSGNRTLAKLSEELSTGPCLNLETKLFLDIVSQEMTYPFCVQGGLLVSLELFQFLQFVEHLFPAGQLGDCLVPACFPPSVEEKGQEDKKDGCTNTNSQHEPRIIIERHGSPDIPEHFCSWYLSRCSGSCFG